MGYTRNWRQECVSDPNFKNKVDSLYRKILTELRKKKGISTCNSLIESFITKNDIQNISYFYLKVDCLFNYF